MDLAQKGVAQVTCIVGVVEEGRVWLGGDSAGVAGWYSVARRDPKVFRNGPFVMGFTSSFRMGQLLRHALKPPEWYQSCELEAWMVTAFIDSVRECLKAGGWATKDKEQEEGGSFLVGYQGRLFEIGEDYQVGEPLCGYAAVGCGREVAMGALYATPDASPKERIRKALAAASAFSAAVRPPFHVICGGDA